MKKIFCLYFVILFSIALNAQIRVEGKIECTKGDITEPLMNTKICIDVYNKKEKFIKTIETVVEDGLIKIDIPKRSYFLIIRYECWNHLKNLTKVSIRDDANKIKKSFRYVCKI